MPNPNSSGPDSQFPNTALPLLEKSFKKTIKDFEHLLFHLRIGSSFVAAVSEEIQLQHVKSKVTSEPKCTSGT